MLIEEIWDRIRIRSGQFILNKSKIELNVENFRVLVEDALAEYSLSRPFEKHYSQYIGEPRSLKLTANFDPEIKMIPEWFAEVTPTRAYGGNQFLFSGAYTNPNAGSELIQPLQAPWDYTKPILTVPYSGNYKLVAVYNHVVSEIEDDNGVKQYHVNTINVQDDPWFFKLLQGLFLQGIGRSRRSFTLSDIPILMDADQLYSEGQAIEEKALEEIHANKKIYLTGR